LTTILSTRDVIRSVAVAYILLLAGVSLMPSGIEGLEGWDAAMSPTLQNTLHVPAYVMLVILVTASFWSAAQLRVGHVVAVAAVCIGYGAALEFLQLLIPGRVAGLVDVVLNATGALVGCLVLLVWRTRKQKVAC